MLLLLHLTPASVPGSVPEQPVPDAREKTGLCHLLLAPCACLAALPGCESGFHSVPGGFKHGWDFPSSRKCLFTSQGLNHSSRMSHGSCKTLPASVPAGKDRGDGLQGAKEDAGARGSRFTPGTRRWVKLQDAAGRRATKKGSWVTYHNPGKKIQNMLPGLPSALRLAAEEMTLREMSWKSAKVGFLLLFFYTYPLLRV